LGVFGLVLFEYGLLRNTRQFRFQAYVALAAAFGRIFFANLTAGNPGEFWGTRMYTVLPLTLIFFFVYAQLGQTKQVSATIAVCISMICSVTSAPAALSRCSISSSRTIGWLLPGPW